MAKIDKGNVIEECMSCSEVSRWAGRFMCKKQARRIITNPTKYFKGFPDWCPLPDKKEEV